MVLDPKVTQGTRYLINSYSFSHSEYYRMSHRFFKYNSNTSGLPGRVASSLWEKITKKAHDVWSINTDGGSPTVNRLRSETVNSREEPVHAHPEIEDSQEFGVGDIVLLFMGGQRITARVASINGGDATIDMDGAEATVPVGWLHKRADDNPADAKAMVSDSLSKLLQSRGGKCAIRLSPSTMMSLVSNPDGSVQVRMFEISTRQMHSGNYPSVDSVVHDLNLVNYPEEIDLEALHKFR